ncbi:GNAT family N-acetyltransferase [bacterium]|nr:GNAT family N-acetyltransferase [bacterium]
MEILRATIRDIDRILEIERACYDGPEAWGRQDWEFSLNSPLHDWYYAEDFDGTILAMGGGEMVHRTSGNVFYINGINTVPKARRHGYAKKLLRHIYFCYPLADYMVLTVREANAGARDLYEKFGFRPYMRIQDHYQEPEEDAIMYRIECMLSE